MRQQLTCLAVKRTNLQLRENVSIRCAHKQERKHFIRNIFFPIFKRVVILEWEARRSKNTPLPAYVSAFYRVSDELIRTFKFHNYKCLFHWDSSKRISRADILKLQIFTKYIHLSKMTSRGGCLTKKKFSHFKQLL